MRQFKLKSQRFVNDCLKAAMADGLLARGVSHEEGGLLVLGAIYAIGHMSIRANDLQEKSAVVKRVWLLLEKALMN